VREGERWAGCERDGCGGQERANGSQAMPSHDLPSAMPRPAHYRIGSVDPDSLRCFTPPVKTSIPPGCTVRSSPRKVLVTNSIIWTTEGRCGDPALRHGQLLGMVALPHARLTRINDGQTVTQAC